jgi:hypothetical protein
MNKLDLILMSIKNDDLFFSVHSIIERVIYATYKRYIVFLMRINAQNLIQKEINTYSSYNLKFETFISDIKRDILAYLITYQFINE